MATIYEMTREVEELYEMLQNSDLDAETAEQVLKDHIEGIGADKKVEAYSQIIKQLDADSKMYAAEKKRLDERKKVCDNGIARMKNALTQFLIASGEKKLQGGTFTVSLRTTKAVSVTDESAVPEQYFIPQPSKISLENIKKALAAGEEVAGCVLVENKGVMIK